MPVGFFLEDGRGSENRGGVTSRGQLVTAPLEFSTFYNAATAANNVAVNVVPPKAGKAFVITDLVISGDRSIAAAGAITDIFEADSDTSAVVSKEIYQDEIAKQTRATLTGLNILVSVGKWINVKSDDVIVRANIGGYYVDA